MDKFKKYIKDCFMEEALELENEMEDETIEIPDESDKEKILRNITKDVEI